MNRGNSAIGFFSRALKLFTIFLVLGILITTFSYSDTISKNTSRSSIVLDKTITAQEVINNPKYTRTIVNVEDSKAKTVLDYMIFFSTTNKTLSYNNKSEFTINLKDFIHAQSYTDLDLEISQDPENLSCEINGFRLICKVLGHYSGSDELVLELYDAKFKLKSALKLNFNLTNNYVLPTFNDLEETLTINEDETLNLDLTQFVNNPDNVSYNVNVSQLPNNANCNVTSAYQLVCVPTKDYFGSDSLELKINESQSTMNILLDVVAVNDQPVLDNSKLTNGSVEVNVNDGIHTYVNLNELILDPDYPRSYTYTLPTTNLATCNVADNVLDCVGLKTGVQDLILVLIDDKLTLDIPLHLVVYKNHEPSLDTSKLTNGKILVNLENLNTTTINLKDYVLDVDDVKDYTYEMLSEPQIANCSITNDNLTCNKVKDGLEDFTVKLTDDTFTLDLPIEVQVITPLIPPQYLNNFTDKGITIFEANPNFTIELSGTFNDPNPEDDGLGPGQDTLQYGFDKVAGNAIINCVSGYKKLTCNASGATSFADIQLWAARGPYRTTMPNVYRVAVVDQSDFIGAVIGPQKVINNQPFDMQLSVKSNLGFDIYKLPISVYSVPPVVTHFYYDDGSLDGEFWNINLKAGEVITRKVQVITPNVSEPKDYDLAPKLDGVPSTFTPTVVTSIPYTAQYLKNYLSVVGYTPGHRDDGKDNYLPLGIKTVIPFKISNYLDVPVSVYVCKIATGEDMLIYNSKNTTQEYSNGNYCESIKLSTGLIETSIVAKTDNFYNLYRPYVFLDLQNPIFSLPKISQYGPYKDSSSTFITDNAEMQFYFDELNMLSSKVESPISNTVLNKNTSYDLQVLFDSDYAYSLVDVSVCSYIRKVMDVTNFEYLTDSEIYKINSNNCVNINLGYNSENESNSTITKLFSFSTKNVSYDGATAPWHQLTVGYNTLQQYKITGYGNYKVN